MSIRHGLAFTLVLTTACEQKPTASVQPVAPKHTVDDAPVTPPASSKEPPVIAKPASMPTNAVSEPLTTASNAFALDLWGKLRGTPGNLAMSPASITIALAMTWGGARAETSAEMRRVLHLPSGMDPDAVMTGWGAMSRALQDPTRPLKLRIANRLFGEQTFTFETAFLDKMKTAYDAPLEPLDFKGAAETGRAHINSWVDTQTEHRITNLLPPRSLTADTRLVLVNAIYFLAEWETPFERDATRPAPFHTGKAKLSVPTMHGRGSYRLAKADGVTVLEMPYRGRDAAMLILLPDRIDGLADLEKSLDAKKLAAWTSALTPQEVEVSLPRFVVDPAEPMQLAKHLENLGMKLAFDVDKADFTAIGIPPEPRTRLVLSAVFHKAFVKVDEQGTEAAAATAVGAMGGGMPQRAVPFNADHPFLFQIVDKSTGLILFMGRVVDPA